MPDKYYDVVVIGRSLGCLTAATLLARRDFTVLVIGQGRPEADYEHEGRVLRRHTFTMLAGASPVWRRVMGELAHSQAWRQRVEAVSPMVQMLMSDRRFEVPPDAELFSREVEREFPEVRRLVADLYDDFARVTAAADRAFERDAIWPPGTFLERRETGRVASTLPYARAEPHADLFAEFPRGHIYRRFVTESVRFATDLATMPPAFAVARLHGSWTRGLVRLPGGASELDELLTSRLQANGGRLLMRERVATLEVRRGAVCGVYIDGETRPVGAGFVITDLSGEELAALSGGRGISKRAQRDWPRVTAPVSRFVVSVIARSEGVRAPLGAEAFLIPARGDGEGRTLHVQRVAQPNDGEELLLVEVLLSARDKAPVADLRRMVLQRLSRELPFLDRHLVMVDSVYDGLPLWRYSRDGTPPRAANPLLPDCEVERSAVSGASARAAVMDRQYEIDPPGYLGLAGEPIRGPVGRTLLVGPTVLPGLGQEGRLMAACGAARLVSKSDKRKARMRREMWTKIEIS